MTGPCPSETPAPQSGKPPRLSWLRTPECWAVVGLLAIFSGFAAYSLSRESATFDETAHLPAGYSYLDRGDFRLNPEHPPLFKAWAALPLWISGAARPDYEAPSFRGHPIRPRGGERTGASEWSFGYDFLRGAAGQSMLLRARLAMIVPGIVLGLIVWSWSRRLWGPGGALVSLFFYCLSPTMLAHTRLVTTDLPTALAFVATLWTFNLFCRRPGALRLAAFSGTLALALLVKFSTLLLGPILALLATAWVSWPGLTRGERLNRLRWTGAAAVAASIVGFAGIWAGYGFRFDAARDPLYLLDWSIVGSRETAAGQGIRWAVERRLLPESYLYGLAYFVGGAARRLAFLNGEQSIVGWWYYFPEAFALKTPPALMVACLWVLLVARRGWRSFEGWFVVVPLAIYGGVSVAGNLNIGHRHLVPLYPLLHLACGGLVRAASSRRGRRALAALLLAYAVSFGAASPGYLSYFNLFAGGSAGGWRYLLDSNIDWGQDLPNLRRYMEREGLETVHLAYFGTADPKSYGIRYRKVYRIHDFEPRTPSSRPGPGDYLAVSVNLLQGLYFDRERALADALIRRNWVTREPILEWLEVRERMSSRGERHPGLSAWLEQGGFVSPARLREVESTLLSSWMGRVREQLTPVGRAGDSILIYRIPADF